MRLTQVVANLLNNAVHRPWRSNLAWPVRREEEQVVISVHDMRASAFREKSSSVFGLFRNSTAKPIAPKAARNRPTLVKSLVEMHGGSVEASKRGRTGRGSGSCSASPLVPRGEAAVIRPRRNKTPPSRHHFAACW